MACCFIKMPRATNPFMENIILIVVFFFFFTKVYNFVTVWQQTGVVCYSSYRVAWGISHSLVPMGFSLSPWLQRNNSIRAFIIAGSSSVRRLMHLFFTGLWKSYFIVVFFLEPFFNKCFKKFEVTRLEKLSEKAPKHALLFLKNVN